MLRKLFNILTNKVFSFSALGVAILLISLHWLRFILFEQCVNNSGIALGSLSGVMPIVLIVCIAIILAIVLFYAIKQKDIFLVILFIGGLSNWIDRVIDGFVCDYLLFLDFYINFNDIVISVIVALIVLRDILKEKIAA